VINFKMGMFQGSPIQMDQAGRITTISSPDGDYGLAYYQNGFQRQLVTYPGSVKGD